MAFGDTIVEAVLGKVSVPEDTNNAPNTIAEGAAVNTTVGITAHSTFANGNAGLTYTLSADSSNGGFKIDPDTGVVTVADPSKIDFETSSGHTYSITVLATKNNNFSNEQTFTISVTDIAPSTPVDSNAAANTVAEGAATGTAVGITASSTDVNGPAVTWSLTGDTSGGGFTINATTGVITVADGSKIDYESASGHAYTVTATASDGTLTSSQTFTINVSDVAMSTPVDTNGAANSVAEGAAAGTTVGITASATDPSGPATTYSLIGDTSGGGFTINASTGVVTVANPAKLDFESSAPGHTYNITVQASNGVQTTSQVFTVGVTDVAPSAPTDSNTAAANTVAEGAANGTAVGITASSTDVNGGAVTYSLTGDTSGGGFTINATTGVITVADSTKINFETAPGHAYSVTATASDGTLSNSQSFTIAVTDVAPSAPVDNDGAINTVAEGAANGSAVGITAFSTDVNGGALTYSLVGDTSGGGFTINSTTGVITVADSTKLDYETGPAGHTYTVTAQASDGTLSNQQAFTITLTDVAPSAPTDINNAPNTIAEGAANGSTVGITASSVDPNGPATTYSLTDSAGGRFAIDSSTGIVTVANGAAIDFETAPGHAYGITVLATNGALTTSSAFSIGVTDVAPSAPADTDGTTNHIVEGAANGSTVGITASSTDPGGSPTATYTLTDSAGGRFAINSTTGVVTVANGAAIDYETAPGHAYGITVQSTAGALTNTQNFSITVDNANEAPVNSVPGSQTVNEDTALVFSTANGNAISFSDVDAFGGDETMTLTVASGTLSLGSTLNLTSFTNNASSITLTGTVANINAALNGLTYQGNLNFNGTDTLTVSSNDNGNSGIGTPLSDTDSFNINVTPVNDAPVVTAGHTLNYTENQAATAIDPAITVSDVDSANLASATVQITGNYVNGEDVLGFTNQNGITGSFNAATGTLTLTGSSSVANYQTALASVTYANTSDNPSAAARTVTIVTNDGALNSIAATDTINVTPVNDAPVVTAGHTLNYTENQAATAIDPAIAVSDVDSANLASATVQITGNYVSGEDVLGFTNQNGITGSFNAGTGTLTLTGSSSVANYQTALASVTYVNTSDNPSGAARTVTIVTNDGTANSVAATDTINVTPVNDAPVAAAGHTLAYTENQAATAIDPLITITDVDSANLVSATVQITGNYASSQDILSFTDQNGITGSFNAATGTMTLTGSSSVANYQTALDSVKYSNTSDDPSGATRTVTIITNDGAANSVAVTDTITVQPVNDAPTLTATGNNPNYSNGVDLFSGVTALSVENGQLLDQLKLTVTNISGTATDSLSIDGVTVALTNGNVVATSTPGVTATVAVSGSTATVTIDSTPGLSDAAMSALVDGLSYTDTNVNPGDPARVVTITQLHDTGGTSPGVDTTVLSITSTVSFDQAPVVTAGHTLNYTENQAATAFDPAITVTDSDNANLASATVQITGGYVIGEDVLAFSNTASITGTFDSSTGKLTLTGSDTVAHYQAALASITYVNTSENPSGTPRTVTITANDGFVDSTPVTDTINVTPVNDAPVVIANHTLNYTENQAATAIDPAITVFDVDSANLASATVQITGNYVSGQDVLGFTDQNGITGSFNAGTGTLTLTGSSSVANYQTALASVTYVNTSENPSGLARTVTIITNDGAANSVAKTDTINVTLVNDAPVTTAGGTLNYTENQAAAVIDASVTVTDVDNANMASATVSIGTGFATGQDVLDANVTGTTIGKSYNAATGVLTLTGSDTKAHYQQVLDSVTYFNSSDNPSGAARTINYTVNDGALSSNTSTATVNVTPVNDAPVVTATGTLAYTENQGAAAIAPALTVTDVDSGTLTTASVTISANYVFGEDMLAFTTQNGITGSFNSATGTMTLTGTDTVAHYQMALQSVFYVNTSENPSTAARTVTFTADDGQGVNHLSAGSNHTITVASVDDAPTVTVPGAQDPVSAHTDTAITGISTNDVDAGSLAVKVSLGTSHGNITLDLSGGATLADATTNGSHSVHIQGTLTQVNSALSSLVYHGDAGFTGADALTVQTNDLGHTGTGGPLSSSVATVNIGVIPKVWFIDNTASAVGADGSQGHPFNSIAAFNAINDGGANHAQTGDYIYLKTGTGVYSETDGIHLLNGQQLIGGGDGLTFTDPLNNANTLTIETAGTRPVIDVTGGAGNDAIHLAQDNTIHGFNVAMENAAATGIVDNGGTVGTLNISNMNVGVDPDGGGALVGNLGQAISITHGGTGGSMTFGTVSSGGGATGIALGGALVTSFSATGGTLSGHSSSEFSSNGGSGNVSYAGTIGNGSGDSAQINNRSGGTVTLSGNINDTNDVGGGIGISGNANTTINFTGTTKTLDTGIGDGVSITNNTGTSNVNFTNGGLTVHTTNGTAFSDTVAGTVSVTGTGNTLTTATTNNTGTALNLDHVTVGAGGVLFDSATTTANGANGSANGILLNTLTGGAITVSDGAIAGVTSRGVDINATANDISIGADVSTTSAGRSVEVTSTTGNKTIAFSGAIDDNGQGVNLTTNTGTTMNFTGGLQIDASGTNNGFVATGGGTVNVTGTNHVATGTGTAVNISNTTIGSSGVTFHDVSANGGTNGIILVNTGGGAFTVTGDGTNTTQGGNSTGGTIQNLTGADGTTNDDGASNGIGIGVYLNNASNVTINRMNIHDASNFGVEAENSSNFVMKYTTVGGTNGNNAGQEEGSVRFLELGGTNTLDNNNISGGFTDNVRLDNNTASLTDFIVTNNKIHDNNVTSGNQGILVDFETGAAQTLHITGNTFLHNRANSVDIGASGGAPSSSALINATVDNNTFQGNRSTDLGGGFEVHTANFDGHVRYDISGNVLQPTAGNFGVNQGGAIQVFAGAASSTAVTTGLVEGRINNNTIGVTGVANSGTQQGSGIIVGLEGSGTHTTLITNNTIRQFGNSGMQITAGDAGITGGTFNVSVNGNTIAEKANAAGGAPNGILASFGTSSTGPNSFHVNLDISGNSFAGTGNNVNIGEEDFRIRQRFDTDVFLKGYTGALNDTAAVIAYIQSQNIGTETGSATSNPGTGGVHGFHPLASVPQPTLPPLLAAAGGVQPSSTPSETHDLTQAELDSMVAAAISLWKAAGASDAQLAALHAVTFSVDNLSGDVIGQQGPGTAITMDTNAAGHGWFIDKTPLDNSEFTHAQNAEGTDLLTDPSNAAAGHLDLLTAVTHEMGHVLGLEDSLAPSDAHDLMYIDLVDGERRLPDATDVAQANAPDATQAELALPESAQAAAGTPIVIGTAANDTIDAGLGGNILFGGAGADNFVFGAATPLNAPTPAQITHVADYSAAQGDTFDFSAITSAFHNSGVSDALVVRAVEDASGKFATLQVDHIDPMGLPSAPNWVSVAQLDGAHSGDAVNVLIDGHSSVHLAQIHVDLLV